MATAFKQKSISTIAADGAKVLKLAEQALQKGVIVDGVTLSNFDYDTFPEDTDVDVEILNLAHRDLNRGMNQATGKPWPIFQPIIIGVVNGANVECPVAIGVISEIVDNNMKEITLRHTITERNGKQIHRLIPA